MKKLLVSVCLFFGSVALHAQDHMEYVSDETALLRSTFVDFNGTPIALGQTQAGISLYTFDGQNLTPATDNSGTVFQQLANLKQVVYKNRMYFSGKTPTVATGIFAYDGSTFTQIPFSQTALTLAVLNDTLYISTGDGTIYSYTGSGSPAVVATLTDMSNYYAPAYLTSSEDYIFYYGHSFTNGGEVLRFDGHHGVPLEINPGSGSGFAEYVFNGFALYNNVFYFAGTDGTHGTELWKVVGASNPVRVTDIDPAGDGLPSGESWFAVIGDGIFLCGSDGSSGYEVWRFDITDETVAQVADINPSGDSDPYSLFAWGNVLFFIADDGNNTMLWRYDPADAVPIESYNEGPDYMDPFTLFEYDGSFYAQYTADYAVYRYLQIIAGVEGEQGTSRQPVLYPNPLTSGAKLQVLSDRPLDAVRIWDASGREIYNGQKLEEIKQPGLYEVELIQQGKHSMHRLVVQ